MTVRPLNLLVESPFTGGGRSTASASLLDDELLEAGECLLQALPSDGTAGLDGPAHVPAEVCQAELLLQLGQLLGQGQVLLVR